MKPQNKKIKDWEDNYLITKSGCIVNNRNLKTNQRFIGQEQTMESLKEIVNLVKEETRQDLIEEIIEKIGKIDILPCLCNKNPFDKLCEYNKGFQEALAEIKKIIEEIK